MRHSCIRRAQRTLSRDFGRWKKLLSNVRGWLWRAGSQARLCTKSIAITNLVYLTKANHEDSSLASENLEIIEQQLAILREVTGQALTFHRTQAEAQDWDLVAITESALKLHADKITRHGVTVDSRFQRPTVARAFGTEILQVVSNLILNALDALPRENGRISFRVRTSQKPGRSGTSFRISLPLT